jgi:hypothetical protein
MYELRSYIRLGQSLNIEEYNEFEKKFNAITTFILNAPLGEKQTSYPTIVNTKRG